jgi:hypothetical protein
VAVADGRAIDHAPIGSFRASKAMSFSADGARKGPPR